MKKENPFKKIGGPLRKVPEDTKENVMNSVELIELLRDFSSLFTSNYTDTISSLFKTKNTDEDESDDQ
ncbi:hypothetical protein [Sinomicrobium pectinilyticum]|uniref:Uncharacterized protein n=1 Tax=Sinomicrobium pectinilyticum TaxID=1084421 RepID=A0A3N0DQZ4_SINP1|nr:hypothetical protein [Sinomicrobium pectinilyticum]RNL77921.1 hypothetical protein ED312_20375 [Sinomicrobium pectinilyticum]